MFLFLDRSSQVEKTPNRSRCSEDSIEFKLAEFFVKKYSSCSTFEVDSEEIPVSYPTTLNMYYSDSTDDSD